MGLLFRCLEQEVKMVLRKCPACKNVVSMESYCCPRCGIDFKARKIRRFLFWMIVLAIAGWMVYKHWWK